MSSRKRRDRSKKQQRRGAQRQQAAAAVPADLLPTPSGDRREFVKIVTGAVVSGVVGGVVSPLVTELIHDGSAVKDAHVEPIKISVSDQIKLEDSIAIKVIRASGNPSSFATGTPALIQRGPPDEA